MSYVDKRVHELQVQIDELKKQLNISSDPYDEELYEELRMERNEIAREKGRKPFCILHNETLKEISRKKPITIEDLTKISGIKESKAEKYGERIIQIVKHYL
jgi:ATP-dependent DNA helicase RecQ